MTDEPVTVDGILTDSDILRASYLSKQALPEEIKKLPVEENLSVTGIVTMTDVAVHQPEILAEAVEMSGADDIGE
jgi:CBS domain-containing protein